MFRSWRIGTAFGIPLYLHPTILLLPAIILVGQLDGGWFNAVVMTALTAAIFGCVLLHELGHALTARAFGIRTRDITLYPIGGVASLERMTERPLQEMAIAVAGPAVNLFLVGLLLPVAVLALATGLLRPERLTAFALDDGPAEMAVKFAFLLMVSNGLLMVFNLLPAFPMDGGRVFRAFLALLMDRVRATEIASAVGVALALVLIAAGLASPFTGFGTPILALVGAFVAFAARMELMGVRQQAEQARRAAAYEELPAERVAPLWPSDSDAVVEEDAPPAPNFSGFRWDRQYHVWVLWRNGRPIEVYEAGAE